MTATLSHADIAKGVMATAPSASLATLSLDGMPFNSLITIALNASGQPLMLLSNLAVHTRNLSADSRASLLLVAPNGGPRGEAGDPLAGARLTLSGSITRVERHMERTKAFLARNPEAELYIEFADFHFFEMQIRSAHLVAGFGRIVEIPLEELVAR